MHAPDTVHTGRRTIIRPDLEDSYSRIHARIPAQLEAALRRAGVVSWRIWRDGRTLFHAIETRAGYESMDAAMSSLEPIDPAWDDVIAGLLEPDADSDALLPLVWGMDADSQWGADGPDPAP